MFNRQFAVQQIQRAIEDLEKLQRHLDCENASGSHCDMTSTEIPCTSCDLKWTLGESVSELRETLHDVKNGYNTFI